MPLRSLRFSLPRRRRPLTLAVAGAAVLAVAATPVLASFASHVRLVPSSSAEPGRHADGSARLVNQRSITPAGRQSDLGDLPLNAILAPDGKHLLVSNSGAGIQSLQVVNTRDGSVAQELPYYAPDSVFVGLAYSPDGTTAYASGGGSGVIRTYAVGTDGLLTTGAAWSAGPKQTVSLGGSRLGNAPWPIGLSVSPDGANLYAADNLANVLTIFDTRSGAISGTVPVGSLPYGALVSRDGRRVYVSNWGDATVSAVDTASRAVVATIPVGEHPSALAFGADDILFVADSNSDAVSVVETDRNVETSRVSLAPYPNAPLGTSPEGLSVSPDGRTLYVADSGADEVVLIDLDGTGQPNGIKGRLPTAWYPTAVVPGNDNATIWVANAKGLGAGPNNGTYNPNPTRPKPPFRDVIDGYNDGYCNCTFDNYSGSMIVGTLSTIAVPGPARLPLYAQQVAKNNNYSDLQRGLRAAERPVFSPIPQPGQPSAIKHVIYIIKENRTFDQVFGDESVGDRDPSLTLFPRANTPNLHALAERFGVLDNFYADAEVSADGHNWATSAYATDYNEKMWPQNYSPGPGRNRGYDFEGGSRINLSPGGYLWDAAAEAGITYRDYGEFVSNGSNPRNIPESDAATCPGPIARSYSGVTIPAGQVRCWDATTANPTTTPNLVGHFDPKFRSYDLAYREMDRVAEWEREFNIFVANGQLPQFEILRLPNDHTAGTRPGAPTPQAMVAENDLAVGRVVDVVSHSKYWASSAIFITEDDAQNGPDHVDAHRTTSLAISPYTSGGVRVDHTLYNTSAMLRTMELILGLRPLSQFDANATPMWGVFGNRLFMAPGQSAPYDARAESIPITQVNSATATGAAASLAMDFAQEDRAPSDALNAVIWHAVKGDDVPYPAPADAGQGTPVVDPDGA